MIKELFLFELFYVSEMRKNDKFTNDKYKVAKSMTILLSWFQDHFCYLKKTNSY